MIVIHKVGRQGDIASLGADESTNRGGFAKRYFFQKADAAIDLVHSFDNLNSENFTALLAAEEKALADGGSQKLYSAARAALGVIQLNLGKEFEFRLEAFLRSGYNDPWSQVLTEGGEKVWHAMQCAGLALFAADFITPKGYTKEENDLLTQAWYSVMGSPKH